MTGKEEKALIAECKRDPAAFGRLYDAYFDRIFNYVLYRTGNVQQAEDITAQTFFNAMKNLWKFRYRGISISAWLYRIATNEVNGYYRKQKRRFFTDISSHTEELPDEMNQPDKELEEAEEALNAKKMFHILHQCIQEMKPIEQTIVTLRFFNRKSFSEIAEILGKREATLRVRNSRILKKLKTQLQKKGIDHEGFRRAFVQGTQTGSEGALFSTKPAAEPS